MTTAERRVAVATALLSYLAFIAYQSLAGGAPQPCSPLLAHAGSAWSRGDAIANVVAYVPLGLLVAALGSGAAGRSSFALRSIGWVSLSAFSLAMEVLQACLSARVSSWYDWSMNSLGALIGLTALPIVERGLARATAVLAPREPLSPTARPALLFVGAWLAVSTAPWRFTLDVGTVRANLAFLRRFAGLASIDPWLLAQHAFAWIAIAAALRAVAPDRRTAARWLLAVLAFSLGAQVLLAYRALSWAELFGAAVALAIGASAFPRLSDAWLARWLPAFALVAVAAYELAPLRGAWMRVPFSWWPLLGQGSLLAAMQLALFFSWLAFAVVLSLRWSAYEARREPSTSPPSHRGARIAATIALPSTILLALFALELAQSSIPGRVGDTSPPLVAALAFVVAWVLTERVKDPDRSTSGRSVA